VNARVASIVNPLPVAAIQAAFLAFWDGAIRPAWIVVAVASVLVMLVSVLTPFDYASWSEIAGRTAVIALFLAGAVYCAANDRRYTSLALESSALSVAVALTVPGLSSYIASWGVAYADEALLAADRALGFNWLAIALWFKARPDLSVAMSHIYSSLLWQPAFLLPALAYCDPERLRRVLAASAMALFVTVLFFTIAPAKSGYAHFATSPADFPHVLVSTGWESAKIIANYRGGETQMILEGLITFPSFHAVAAALFAFAWMGIPVLRWPFAILNILMLVSCVPIGSHYVVDVFAGIVLAFAAYRAADRYFTGTDQSAPLPGWRETPEGADLIRQCDSVRAAFWRGIALRATRA
jgi:membrane-associated phospholipid phosphatase